jgi:hypothetical protein
METPSFLSWELAKSATDGAFDGVVTPSALQWVALGQTDIALLSTFLHSLLLDF